MRASRLLGLCAVLIVLAAGCTPAPRYTSGPPSPPAGSAVGPSGKAVGERPPVGTRIRGIASFYADEFNGRKTSNGETFDMHGLTCAHQTLPFNTWIEVRSLKNGRTVMVRVNDRGPFVGNRIIDLSLGAARELRMEQDGIQEVELVIIGYGD